jgi:hypothetical protein
VNALSWLLVAACCAVCVVIGWELRDWRQDVVEFRAEELRNAAWDATQQARGHPGGHHRH